MLKGNIFLPYPSPHIFHKTIKTLFRPILVPSFYLTDALFVNLAINNNQSINHWYKWYSTTNKAGKKWLSLIIKWIKLRCEFSIRDIRCLLFWLTWQAVAITFRHLLSFGFGEEDSSIKAYRRQWVMDTKWWQYFTWLFVSIVKLCSVVQSLWIFDPHKKWTYCKGQFMCSLGLCRIAVAAILNFPSTNKSLLWRGSYKDHLT